MYIYISLQQICRVLRHGGLQTATTFYTRIYDTRIYLHIYIHRYEYVGVHIYVKDSGLHSVLNLAKLVLSICLNIHSIYGYMYIRMYVCVCIHRYEYVGIRTNVKDSGPDLARFVVNTCVWGG